MGDDNKPHPAEVLLREHARTVDQIFHNVSETTSFIYFTALAIAAGAGLLVTNAAGFAFVPLILYAWVYRVVSLDHETGKLKSYKASLEERLRKRYRSNILYYEKEIGERDKPSYPTVLVAVSTHLIGVLVTVFSIWVIADSFGTVAGGLYAALFTGLEVLLVYAIADRSRQRSMWDHSLGLSTAPDGIATRSSRRRQVGAAATVSAILFATPVVIEAAQTEEISPERILTTVKFDLVRVTDDNGPTPWIELAYSGSELDSSRLRAEVRSSLSLAVAIDDGHEVQALPSQAVSDPAELTWVVQAERRQRLVIITSIEWREGEVDRSLSRSEVIVAP